MDVKRDLHAALPRTERQKRRESLGSLLEIIERTGDMSKQKQTRLQWARGELVAFGLFGWRGLRIHVARSATTSQSRASATS